jgi:hypothetical protein
MSERSFRRERERRIAAEERRETRRMRRAAAAAAAAGAFALAAPAVSSAAVFTVNSTGDTGATTCDPLDLNATCELRDAIGKASATGEPDQIVFASSITGQTITLNGTPLEVNDNEPLTIYGGPTADSIYISGNDTSMVFDVEATYTGPPGQHGLTLSGLTIQDGLDDPAGGIYVEGYGGPYGQTDVLLTNSAVTGSTAQGAQVGPTSFAAGGGIANRGRLTVEDSYIAGNESDASAYPAPSFGGGGIDNLSYLTVTGSTITGNYADMFGGGIFNGWTSYPTSMKVTDSTISGNYAGLGGGISGSSFFGGPYGPGGDFGSAHVSLSDSTITGNHAFLDGGGVGLKYLGGSAKWTISHSTISNNDTVEGNGGGLSVGYQGGGPLGGLPSGGTLNVVDSTLSGNYADAYGGGAMVAYNAEKYEGTVQFNNSTIADNNAGFYGGGIASGYTGGYGYGPSVFSTIVADNTGEGDNETPNDLFSDAGQPLQAQPAAARGDGFDLSFSLVENPDGADFTETPAGSNIFGLDPQLGPLGANGGPTDTQLPASGSPVVDKGSAPGNLTTDQRGEPRTSGGGTDIGSVELPAGPPAPPGPPPPGSGGTKVGTLKKKHKKRRRVIRTKNKVAKVRITFRSSNTGVSFQCSVDGGSFSPCKSPFVTKLSSAPGKGKNHRIAIKQVDSAGNQVGNVRTFKFRVVLKD